MNSNLEETLKIIASKLNNKFEESILITSKTSSFDWVPDQPIRLSAEKNFKAALRWFKTYNRIFNITANNNIFRYSIDNAKSFKSLYIAPGGYEISDLNNEINRLMKSNGDYDKSNGTPKYHINISLHDPTGKVQLSIIPDDYVVDFVSPNSLGRLLGFKNAFYPQNEYRAEYDIDITTIDTINIKTDLITGGYIDRHKASILYSFPSFKVPLNRLIVEEPKHLLYKSVVLKDIDKIHFDIVDEDFNIIDFHNEQISLYIEITEV